MIYHLYSWSSQTFFVASIGGEIKPTVIECPASAQVSWVFQKEKGDFENMALVTSVATLKEVCQSKNLWFAHLPYCPIFIESHANSIVCLCNYRNIENTNFSNDVLIAAVYVSVNFMPSSIIFLFRVMNVSRRLKRMWLIKNKDTLNICVSFIYVVVQILLWIENFKGLFFFIFLCLRFIIVFWDCSYNCLKFLNQRIKHKIILFTLSLNGHLPLSASKFMKIFCLKHLSIKHWLSLAHYIIPWKQPSFLVLIWERSLIIKEKVKCEFHRESPLPDYQF